MFLVGRFVLLFLCFAFAASLKPMITNKVFFQVDIDDEPAGRIVMGLYGRNLPRTVQNFLDFATKNIGRSKDYPDGYSYKGSHFHRAVKKSHISGGHQLGKGIYDPRKLEWETGFPFNHTRAGQLTTFSSKYEEYLNSRFRITTDADETKHDGKHTVFGTVLEGMDIVWAMESLDRWWTSNRSLPVECRILHSGELELEQPFRDEIALEETKYIRPKGDKKAKSEL